MPPKTTKVKCGHCNKMAEVATASIEKDQATIWQCPHCAEKNTIEPK